jgi:hypothetical protein
MDTKSWSPEDFGINNRQNLILWNDLELAYQYVETHAPFSISGDVHGFLFSLVRKRWNLACANIYEDPVPDLIPSSDYSFQELLAQAPNHLTLSQVEKLALKKRFVESFKEFANQRIDLIDHEPIGKLFGYGTDGYGTYLPLHLLWPRYKKYWGIYISESGVLSLAANLYRACVPSQMMFSPDDESKLVSNMIQIAYQVILRHQLFHFKVEQWTLLFELATGKPYYLPYLEYVYLPTIYDNEENNLEEALANLSVLLSKKLLKLEKEIGYDTVQVIESRFLSQQGPNYRNYNLRKGVALRIEGSNRQVRYRKVINCLCNQIIQHDVFPKETVPYYLYPPNNNFLRAEDLCPIYLIRNLSSEIGIIA